MSETVQENQTPETDSMDKIVKDFNIEETATQFRSQVAPQSFEPPPQPVREPQKTEVPDPFDTEAHKAYLARMAQGQSALEQTLNQAMTKISAYEQKASREALESDIGRAVKVVNEIVQHPNPKMVEVALELAARDDPKFKTIWDNRAKNPQALERALKVKANQIAEEFSVKVDPKLVTSQRALKNSQSQTATTTTKEPDKDSEWEGLSEEEFQQRWARAVNGTM
jgi:flagellar hook-basal body complex protein FliE